MGCFYQLSTASLSGDTDPENDLRKIVSDARFRCLARLVGERFRNERRLLSTTGWMAKTVRISATSRDRDSPVSPNARYPDHYVTKCYDFATLDADRRKCTKSKCTTLSHFLTTRSRLTHTALLNASYPEGYLSVFWRVDRHPLSGI